MVCVLYRYSKGMVIIAGTATAGTRSRYLLATVAFAACLVQVRGLGFVGDIVTGVADVVSETKDFSLTDTIENAACETCAKGKWRRKCDDCKDCAAGRYNDMEDQPFCTYCSAGKFASGTGSVQDCTRCPRGYSSPLGGDRCFRCPIGRFTPPIGESSEHSLFCVLCPSGWKGVNYKTDHGKAFLVRNRTDLETEPELCEPCEPGRYTDNAQSIFAGTVEMSEWEKIQNGQEINIASIAEEDRLRLSFDEIMTNGYRGSVKKNNLGAATEVYGHVDPVCPQCGVGTGTERPGQSTCLECAPVSILPPNPNPNPNPVSSYAGRIDLQHACGDPLAPVAGCSHI